MDCILVVAWSNFILWALCGQKNSIIPTYCGGMGVNRGYRILPPFGKHFGKHNKKWATVFSHGYLLFSGDDRLHHGHGRALIPQLSRRGFP